MIFQKFPHDVPIMLSKFSILFHNFPFYIPSGVAIEISKVHNYILKVPQDFPLFSQLPPKKKRSLVEGRQKSENKRNTLIK
jgi:hypothetical protein